MQSRLADAESGGEELEFEDDRHLQRAVKDTPAGKNWTSAQRQLRDQVAKELQTIKRLAVNQNEGNLQCFGEDFLGWFEQQPAEDIQCIHVNVIDICYYIAQYCMDKKCSVKQYFQEKVAEFVVQLLVKINRIAGSLESRALYTEVRIATELFHGVYNVNPKKLDALFDSAYLVCSLENFIRVTSGVIKKCHKIPEKAFIYFAFWLSQKLEKSQNYALDKKLLNKSMQTIQKFAAENQAEIFKTLYDALLKKFQIPEDFSSGHRQSQPCLTRPSTALATGQGLSQGSNPGNNFNMSSSGKKSHSLSVTFSGSSFETPKSKRSKYLDLTNSSTCHNHHHPQQQLQGPQQQMHNVSQILNSTLTNNKSQLKLIEEELDSNFGCALERLKNYVSGSMRSRRSFAKLSPQSQMLSPSTNRSPGRPWRRGMGRDASSTPLKGGQGSDGSPHMVSEIRCIVEKLCMNTEKSIASVPEIFGVLSELRSYLGQQQDFLLFNVFLYVCRLGAFEDRALKQHLDSLHGALMKGMLRTNILSAYKQSFSYCFRQFDMHSCHNLIKNAFIYIVYQILEDDIQLQDISYFVETVVFCLSEKLTHTLGDELMNKLYHNYHHEQLRKIFEVELLQSNRLYLVFLDWHNQYLSQLPSDSNRKSLELSQDSISNQCNNNSALAAAGNPSSRQQDQQDNSADAFGADPNASQDNTQKGARFEASRAVQLPSIQEQQEDGNQNQQSFSYNLSQQLPQTESVVASSNADRARQLYQEQQSKLHSEL